MPLISLGRDSSLLHLQYLTNSIGLRRNYLDEDSDVQQDFLDNSVLQPDHITKLVKPSPIRIGDAVQRPEIEWYPKYKTYQARVSRLASSGKKRPDHVPDGFPSEISSKRVWTGSDFAEKQYLLQLCPEDIDEIKAALAHFQGTEDLGPDDVTTETFPLPVLGERLVGIAENIHRGTGFNVIRGLDPTHFSPLENVLVYLGITSYLAEIRGVQDYDGRMIVHIKDIEKELPDASGRPSPYTSRAQPFHTDMCDILSMYVLDTATAGGESLLASSAMIYNEIAATRPDIIHVLADDKWIHDDFNKVRPSWYYRQLLHNFKEHGPSFLYSRRPLTGAPFSPHHPDVPAMSEEQAEALDAVHFAAEKHQLRIRLEPGDIEIFNNMAMFHGRSAFENSAEPPLRDVIGDSDAAKRSLNGTRHMLRLWLKSSDPNLAWETPAPLRQNSFLIYGNSEARKLGKWDVHRAPPINRKLTKHFKCS